MGDETNLPTTSEPVDRPAVMPEPAADIRISVLGPVTMTRAGVPVKVSKQRRRTLAILAVAGPEGQTIDWLAEQLWIHDLPSDWQGHVRVAINRLGHAVDLPVRSDGGRYRLPVDPAAVDAWELLHLDRSGTGWDPRLEAHLAEIELTRSIEPFPALEAAQADYRAAQHSAIAKLARHPHPASPRQLVIVTRHHQAHPTDEALSAAVALTHTRAGQIDEALAIIDRTVDSRRAASLAPSPRLAELRAAIAGGTVNLDGPTAGPAGPPSTVTTPDGGSPRVPAPTRVSRLRASHFVGRQPELGPSTA